MKSENSNVALARLSYGLTIFLGAFLMFQIQPLVGKVCHCPIWWRSGDLVRLSYVLPNRLAVRIPPHFRDYEVTG